MCKKKRIAYYCVFTLMIVVMGVIYYKYSPTDSSWFPRCPFKQLTGWSCPACGFQRATHSFLNGRLEEALTYNYFYVLGIPYFFITILAYCLKRVNRGLYIAEKLEHRKLAMIYVYCFFAWFFIRNIFGI